MQFSHYAVIAPYIKHELYYLPFVVIIGKEAFPAVWLLRALSSHDQFLSTASPLLLSIALIESFLYVSVLNITSAFLGIIIKTFRLIGYQVFQSCSRSSYFQPLLWV